MVKHHGNNMIQCIHSHACSHLNKRLQAWLQIAVYHSITIPIIWHNITGGVSTCYTGDGLIRTLSWWYGSHSGRTLICVCYHWAAIGIDMNTDAFLICLPICWNDHEILSRFDAQSFQFTAEAVKSQYFSSSVGIPVAFMFKTSTSLDISRN